MRYRLSSPTSRSIQSCLMFSVAAVLIASSVSCNSSNFDKPSQLNGLRVFALVVDQPFIKSPSGNTTLSLTPYVSDIGGSGNISVTVQSCLDPGIKSSGPLPDCTNGANASSVQTSTISSSSGSSNGIFGDPERTGAPSAAISVPLTIPSGFLDSYSQQLQYNGVPYLVTVTVSNGTTTVKAYRNIYISNQAADTNPTMSDILLNGSSLSSLPTVVSDLSASITSSPASYSVMSATGQVANAVQVYQTNWFVSDGTVISNATDRTGVNAWTPPTSAPSGRKTVVVGVLRNGRGGESVVVRAF